jgi:hypothetical protein
LLLGFVGYTGAIEDTGAVGEVAGTLVRRIKITHEREGIAFRDWMDILDAKGFDSGYSDAIAEGAGKSELAHGIDAVEE